MTCTKEHTKCALDLNARDDRLEVGINIFVYPSSKCGESYKDSTGYPFDILLLLEMPAVGLGNPDYIHVVLKYNSSEVWYP